MFDIEAAKKQAGIVDEKMKIEGIPRANRANRAKREAEISTISTISTPPPPKTEKSIPHTQQLPTELEASNGDNLLETLADICKSLTLTPDEVKQAMAEDDIQAWCSSEINIEQLAAFATLLSQQREMRQGKRPATFTEPATCRQCGPIWLWARGQVDSCPWCANRRDDRPIPRPVTVQCCDCFHYHCINHPHLGHCAKHEPEPPAGLWATTHRYCERYQPKVGASTE